MVKQSVFEDEGPLPFLKQNQDVVKKMNVVNQQPQEHPEFIAEDFKFDRNEEKCQLLAVFGDELPNFLNRKY